MKKILIIIGGVILCLSIFSTTGFGGSGPTFSRLGPEIMLVGPPQDTLSSTGSHQIKHSSNPNRYKPMSEVNMYIKENLHNLYTNRMTGFYKKEYNVLFKEYNALLEKYNDPYSNSLQSDVIWAFVGAGPDGPGPETLMLVGPPQETLSSTGAHQVKHSSNPNRYKPISEVDIKEGNYHDKLNQINGKLNFLNELKGMTPEEVNAKKYELFKQYQKNPEDELIQWELDIIARLKSTQPQYK